MPSFSEVTVPLTVNVAWIVVVETDVVELCRRCDAVVVVELVGSDVFFSAGGSRGSQDQRQDRNGVSHMTALCRALGTA